MAFLMWKVNKYVTYPCWLLWKAIGWSISKTDILYYSIIHFFSIWDLFWRTTINILITHCISDNNETKRHIIHPLKVMCTAQLRLLYALLNFESFVKMKVNINIVLLLIFGRCTSRGFWQIVKTSLFLCDVIINATYRNSQGMPRNE